MHVALAMANFEPAAGVMNVITALALSPGSREWLDEQGISWADERGRFHLTGGGVKLAS